ncbi:MAG: ankyrin repeat domain-containing protein [Bacteroidales bacterium]
MNIPVNSTLVNRILILFFIFTITFPMGLMGQSRLYNAVESDNESRVKRFLKKGDNPNGEGNPRNIPLIAAAEKNLYHMVQLLVENKANINIQNHIGFTPLMEATIQRNNRIMTYLIRNDANLEIKANNGATALMVAVNADNIRGARLLLEANANPNISDIEGNTPLMKTINLGKNPDMIALLVEFGADVNAKGLDGTPVLMAYPYRDRIPVYKELIAHEADLNITNAEGQTPLIKAVLEGNLEMVKILMEHGANPHIKDDFDASAIDYSITQFNIKQYFDSLPKEESRNQ